jgi:hypothetical protein
MVQQININPLWVLYLKRHRKSSSWLTFFLKPGLIILHELGVLKMLWNTAHNTTIQTVASHAYMVVFQKFVYILDAVNI